jgi:hypothetical protein
MKNKKGFINIIIFLLVIFALIGMFLCNDTRSSSVTDNTSRGIVLVSTARVNLTECARFKLPAANPAAIAEHGLGDVIEFTDATQDAVLGTIKIPKGIDTTVQPKLQIEWSGDATGDTRLALTYVWIGSDETTDETSGTTVTDDYSSGTVVKGLTESEVQLAGMAAGDMYLQFKIARIADHTNDTIDGQDVNIKDACLLYTINRLGESL